eukprot:Colp12_sorted_trinity150504_noHs@10998
MSQREIKLCLLGHEGVGKSSLVLRFVTDTFNPNSESTIGASFMSKALTVGDQNFKYQIWDTAGQEKYRGLAPMYYRGAAAAIIVFDITREVTFNALKDWVKELKQFGPSNIVIAIAGNKSDLKDQRQVPSERAQEYAESIEALYIETSALTAENVKQLFEQISKMLPQDAVLPTGTGATINLQTAQKPQKKSGGGCC